MLPGSNLVATWQQLGSNLVATWQQLGSNLRPITGATIGKFGTILKIKRIESPLVGKTNPSDHGVPIGRIHNGKSVSGSVPGSIKGSEAAGVEDVNVRHQDFLPPFKKKIGTLTETPLRKKALENKDDYFSVIDGEEAHKQVKGRIEAVLDFGVRSYEKIPSFKMISKHSTSTTTLLSDRKQALMKKKQWKKAGDIIQQQLYDELPEIDMDFGISFFMKAIDLKDLAFNHPDFVPTLALILEELDLDDFPREVLELYHDFFVAYQVQETHTTEHLTQLYKLAQRIKGDIQWLKEAEFPQVVVVEDGIFRKKFLKYMDKVKLFMEYRQFFSWDYIKLMKSQLDEEAEFRNPNLKTFLNILSHKNTTFNSKYLPSLLEKFLEIRAGNLKQIQVTADRLLLEFQLDMDVVLSYVEVGLRGDLQTLVRYIKEGKHILTTDQFLAYVTIEANQKKENIEEQEVKEKQERDLMEQEERRQKINEQTKLKKQQEKNQQKFAYQKMLKEKLCEMQEQQFQENKLELEEAQDFREDLQTIASQLNKIIRVEQLVIMGMLLNSQKYKNLVQLATNFGKSFMIGMMAVFLNQKHKEKVVVVTPTDTLASVQQTKFCPLASDVHDDLWDEKVKSIHYCTYEDFLTGKIPLDAILLIDEIDLLFFNDAPKIIKGKLISSVLLLDKYKVYGLSATFRGNQGKRKINQLLSDCNFIETDQKSKERILNIDVFGRQDKISAKIIEITREKVNQMPVVIILKSINECVRLEKLFNQENCFVFGQGRVPIQLGVLGLISKQRNPFPIVLTTPFASIGHDITEEAYVIQTDLSESWATFVQNAGRGNRVDPNAVLTGAFITSKPFADIAAVKQGCEYEEQKHRLYENDYLQSLKLVEKCCKIDSTKRVLFTALDFIKKKKSFEDVLSLLCKEQAFNQMLNGDKKSEQIDNVTSRGQQNSEVQTNTKEDVPDFDMDVIANSNLPAKVKVPQKPDEGLLGKRKQSEGNSNQKVCNAPPRQLTPSEKRKANNLAKHAKGTASILGFASPAAKRQKIEEAKSASECKEIHDSCFTKSNYQTPTDYGSLHYCSLCTVALNGFCFSCPVCTFEFCFECGSTTTATLKRQKRDEAAEEVLQYKESAEEEQEQLSEFQMDPEALKQKELQEAAAVFEKHGHTIQLKKVPGTLSCKSIQKTYTECERDIQGRFKQKYKVGDRAADGSIIKEVDEDAWQRRKQDDKGNWYFKCLKCDKENVRKEHRKRHKCLEKKE